MVGSQTVRQLVADGHRVVATDLGTSAQCKAARSLPDGATARWADLTDPAEVVSVDLGAMPLSLDAPFLESALPTDGRIHTVDVRDVALRSRPRRPRT
nr:hypothetical protein MFLOJ_42130 [Mycobacterium florentinum]